MMDGHQAASHSNKLMMAGATLCLAGVAMLSSGSLSPSSVPTTSSESTELASAGLRGKAVEYSWTPLCYNGRVAPTLFIIGCQKCGTTSLWSDAVQNVHGLTTGNYKEHHYWHVDDSRYVDGSLDNYILDYPSCDDIEEPETPSATQVIGADFDPDMGFSDVAPAIHDAYVKALGEASLDQLHFVAILRNPVNRTQSYFYHALEEGWLDVAGCDDCCESYWQNCSGCTHGRGESCCTVKLTYSEVEATCNTTFDHWVDTQIARADACLANGTTDLWPTCGEKGLFASMYTNQIKLFVDTFGKDKVSIIPFDAYTADASVALDALANLTGSISDYVAEAADKNTASDWSRSYEEMTDATAKKLRDYLEPYTQDLYNYINDNDIHVWGNAKTDFL